jgi:nitrite reductase (NADH) small subunit
VEANTTGQAGSEPPTIAGRWVVVAMMADCPSGSARECMADDRVVALYNVDGQLYALDGICPHQGGPLGKGRLQGCIVTCPWHGWQFDVRSGQSLIAERIVQPTLPVRVVDGQVEVRVS